MRTFVLLKSIYLLTAFALGLGWGPVTKGEDADGVKLGPALTQRWQVGMIVDSMGTTCVGIYGTATVPTDWPEQSVKIIEEKISPQVSNLTYRTLDNGVRQMVVTIAQLNPGETAQAMVTFEVTRHALLPPDDPSQFRVPARPPREVRPFLGTSPYIESRHPKIRDATRDVVKAELPAWQQVEAIYDWVREHVEYKNGELKGALAALNDKTGDCEELTSLFIAMCRCSDIPARTVWVPGHCYPEFYLEDAAGKGHWFPCQAAGTRSFGGIPEQRPILQKGDNYKVPEKKEPQRYVAEFLKMKGVRGGGKPNVRFVRDLLPAP